MKNEVKALKLKVEYETDIARCETCVYISKPRIVLTTNSRTRKTPYWCNLNLFVVAKNSICNEWTNKNGQTL